MKKEVTYSLGYLLDRTLWALSNSLNVALKNEGIDLPHSQYLVLRTLFEKDGLSQNEIVVRKTVAHSKYNVFLTEKSLSLQSKIMLIVDKVFSNALINVSEDMVNISIQVLETIYKSSINKNIK